MSVKEGGGKRNRNADASFDSSLSPCDIIKGSHLILGSGMVFKWKYLY